MPNLVRRRTTCQVPEHGTWCSVSQERDKRYDRATEEHMAMDFEATANEFHPYDPDPYGKWTYVL